MTNSLQSRKESGEDQRAWQIEEGGGCQRALPRRINVAVSPEIVTALETVIDREGVTLTEAAQRLLDYGDYLYRTSKINKKEVLVRDGQSLTEILLL